MTLVSANVDSDQVSRFEKLTLKHGWRTRAIQRLFEVLTESATREKLPSNFDIDNETKFNDLLSRLTISKKKKPNEPGT